MWWSGCGRVVVVLCVMVVVEVVMMAQGTQATKMHYIHWNTSNPIFRIDNTDHIIDVNKGNIPFEYDQVNIICPVYTQQDTAQDEAEKYIIYNVSKEEYDTCRITNPSPRVIAVCDKPYKLMYFTITFRSFTPQPGGLEFRPGQDYYFISTSSKDDLHRRIGGRCSTHHMKVVFKVCCDPASVPARDQANNHLPANGPSTTRGTTTTTTSSTSSSTKPSSTTTTPKSTSTTTTSTTTTSSKNTSHKASDQDKTTHKKSDSSHPDRSQNEVVKNEELTLNAAPPSSSPSYPSLLLLSLLLAALTLLHHNHNHNHHHSLHHTHHLHHNHYHSQSQQPVVRCFPATLSPHSRRTEEGVNAPLAAPAPSTDLCGGGKYPHIMSPS